MKQLQAFVAATARRVRRAPRLQEALLTHRRAAYVGYRLRYLLLRVPLRCALHFMEVLLFANVIWPEYLPFFLLLRSGAAAANGLLWGALEMLRGQVRAAPPRELPRARAIIERWLGASLWLQLSLGLAALAYLRWAPTPFSSFSILDAYAIAVFARLAMDVFTRVYHAGIYARRRVYRPLWSVLAGDVADVALVALFFPWLGAWAFAPALLLGGTLKSGLTLWFTARAYRQLPLLRPRVRAMLRPAALSAHELAQALRYAIANLGGQLDAWIVVALAVPAHGGAQLALATLLHVLRPLIAAGAGWSRLFYFDFKQLERDAAGLLRERFDRLLRRVAWLAGGTVAAATAVASLGVPALALPWSLWPWLLLFLLARSIFGLRQLQAFVDERWSLLLWQSGCVVAALLAVPSLAPLAPSAQLALPLLTLSLLAAVLLSRGHARRVQPSGGGQSLTLEQWGRELYSATGSVRVCVAEVDRAVASSPRVARALSHELAGRGAALAWQRRHMVWFEPGPGALAAAMVASAGALRNPRCGPCADGGRAALSAANDASVLPDTLWAALSDTPQARAQRARELVATHPGAQLLDLQSGPLSLPAGSEPRSFVHDLLRALARARHGQSRTRHHGLELVVMGPAGPIVALPLASEDEDRTTAGG